MAHINRASVKSYRKSLQDHLDEWCRKNDLRIDIGRITYTDHSFRFKAEFVSTKTPRITSQVPNPDAKPYSGRVPFGARREWVGMTFKMADSRDELEVVGFKPTAKKNTVIVATPRGTRYVMPPHEVARYLRDK